MRANLLTKPPSLLVLVGLFVVVDLLPSAQAQANSPLAGTWKANLAKSERHPNHQFESLTLRLEVSDDAVLVIYTGVNMSGQQESGTRKLHPDGKEYPIAEAPGAVEVTKWVGAKALKSEAKKDGKVVGASAYEVSSDGKTLTAKVKGVDASGREFEQVIVFDRQ